MRDLVNFFSMIMILSAALMSALHYHNFELAVLWLILWEITEFRNDYKNQQEK